MTQKKLAEASGVRQNTISDIETGDTGDPGIRTVQKLARTLGVTSEKLFPFQGTV